MADNIDDIVDASMDPAEAEGEAGRVKARTIQEQLAARQAKAEASVTGSAWAATKPARIIPPGSIGERSS